MLTLLFLFVLLHVVTAAAWFGLALRIGGQARAALTAGGAAGETVADEGQRSVRLMNIFVVLTLLFGLGAFFAGGGFGVYGPVYHTSILLIVILAAVQFFVIRPGWQQLRAALGGAGDPESARKRVAIGTGVGHLVWLTLLVLMFWRGYGSAIF